MENNFLTVARDNGEIISKKILVAHTFESRLIGLMFKKDLNDNDGLLIDPCNSIHTFFMLMDIDVVFLDKNNKVVKVIYQMKPWRISWLYFKAVKVLEMPAGKLIKDIHVGDVLRLYV